MTRGATCICVSGVCAPFFLLRQGALLGCQSSQRRWGSALGGPLTQGFLSPSTHRFSNGLSHALPSAWNPILPFPAAPQLGVDDFLSKEKLGWAPAKSWAGQISWSPGRRAQGLQLSGDHPDSSPEPVAGDGLWRCHKFDSAKGAV